MPREYRNFAELARDVSQFLEAITHPNEIVIDVGPQSFGPTGTIEGPDHYTVRHASGVEIAIHRNAIEVSRPGGPPTSWAFRHEQTSINGPPTFHIDLAHVLARAVTLITDDRVHHIDEEDLNPIVWNGDRIPSGRALIEEVNRRLEEWAQLPGTVEHGALRERDGQLETFDRGWDWASEEAEREAQRARQSGRSRITARQRPRGPHEEPPTLIRNFEEFVEMYGRPDGDAAHVVERCFREGADRVTVEPERITLPSGETVTLRPMTAEDETRIQRSVETGRGLENAMRPMILESNAATEEVDLRPRSSQRENESAFGRAVRKRIREASRGRDEAGQTDAEE